mgnify:CR=1 FL=1
MSRRRRRSHQLPRELRRKVRQMWQRAFCCTSYWPSWLDWLCLAVGAMIWLLASATSRGDTIIMIDYYQQTVFAETGGWAPEVGQTLSGRGNPLGWITFAQPEPWSGLGPLLEFGSYSDQYGGFTQQTLQFFGDADGYVRTANYGDVISGNASNMISTGYVRQDTQIPIGHRAVYVPFAWSSYADQFGDEQPDTMFGGSGWISITQLNQVPNAGQPASFTIGEILLTNLDSYSGQTQFQTVPEPSTWVVCCVGLVGFGGVYFYRRGRR